MGSVNVILSFFKENKVDYSLNIVQQIVKFPCLYCGSTVEMCTLTTYWNCDFCNENGNLLILIKYFKEGNKLIAKVYNPKKEQQIIGNKFKCLTKKFPALKNDLVDIENRVMQLIIHYKKEPK